MRYLTAKRLQEHGACVGELEQFKCLFGKRLDLTDTKLIKKSYHAFRCSSLEWLAVTLLGEDDYAAYAEERTKLKKRVYNSEKSFLWLHQNRALLVARYMRKATHWAKPYKPNVI